MSKKFPLFHFLFPQKNIRFFFIKNKLKDTPHSIKKEECLSQQPEGVGGLLGGTHNIGNFRLFTFSFLKRGDFSLFTCLVPLKTFRQQPEGVGGLLGRRCTQHWEFPLFHFLVPQKGGLFTFHLFSPFKDF